MELEQGLAIVKIFTRDLAIVGKIMITEKEFHRGRLSDYFNRADLAFIPVQDAHIFRQSQCPLQQGDHRYPLVYPLVRRVLPVLPHRRRVP